MHATRTCKPQSVVGVSCLQLKQRLIERICFRRLLLERINEREPQCFKPGLPVDRKDVCAIGICCCSARILAKVSGASSQQVRSCRPISALQYSWGLLSQGLRVFALTLAKGHLSRSEHEDRIREVSTSR